MPRTPLNQRCSTRALTAITFAQGGQEWRATPNPSRACHFGKHSSDPREPWRSVVVDSRSPVSGPAVSPFHAQVEHYPICTRDCHAPTFGKRHDESINRLAPNRLIHAPLGASQIGLSGTRRFFDERGAYRQQQVALARVCLNVRRAS